MKNFIDFVYTLLIGVAVLLFVSLGIWSFYTGPKMPEFPMTSAYPSTSDSEAMKKYEAENQKAQEEYNKQFKDYEAKQKPYSRNVSMAALAAAAVFFAAGLWLRKRNDLVAEGLSLGGIFTAIYSAIRAGTGEAKQVMFLAVTLLLVMTIVLVVRRDSGLKPKKS